jgi:hypothetical protein
VKYLVEPTRLGPLGAALFKQLFDIRKLTEPPTQLLASPPIHPTPSPTKMSNRTRRRLKLLAAERRGKRRAHKAARKRNRER